MALGKLIILIDEAHLIFKQDKFYGVDHEYNFKTPFNRLPNANWVLFSGTYGG